MVCCEAGSQPPGGRVAGTYRAAAVAGLAAAGQRRAAGQAEFRVLSEDADPPGSERGRRVKPVLWCFPSPAETVPWLEAVAQKTPRVLLGRGLQLLPIFIDLF